MDLPTVIINSSVSDSPIRGGGGDGGTSSASPLPFYSVDLIGYNSSPMTVGLNTGIEVDPFSSKKRVHAPALLLSVGWD